MNHGLHNVTDKSAQTGQSAKTKQRVAQFTSRGAGYPMFALSSKGCRSYFPLLAETSCDKLVIGPAHEDTSIATTHTRTETERQRDRQRQRGNKERRMTTRTSSKTMTNENMKEGYLVS